MAMSKYKQMLCDYCARKSPEKRCDSAAKKGHLNCLRIACETCPLTVFAAARAAAEGHLDCLKFIHSTGLQFTPFVCEGACVGGHLECLKYAHQPTANEEIPFGISLSNAIFYGHIECLRYILQSGEGILNAAYYTRLAKDRKQYRCLLELIEFGFPHSLEDVPNSMQRYLGWPITKHEKYRWCTLFILPILRQQGRAKRYQPEIIATSKN